ncbi:MAG: EscU/YscU/HrcU family type III secretion system export apparatus switch protein [Pseudomonadota bacterium]
MSQQPPSKPSALQSAVALAYATGDAAPRVVAKGKGMLAQAIIDRAQEAGVYVHPAPELVSLLMQVDLDKSIPPNLYIAVAELLVWLYRLEEGGEFASKLAPMMNSPIKKP